MNRRASNPTQRVALDPASLPSIPATRLAGPGRFSRGKCYDHYP